MKDAGAKIKAVQYGVAGKKQSQENEPPDVQIHGYGSFASDSDSS